MRSPSMATSAGGGPGPAGPVDHRAVADDQVVHRRPPRSRLTCSSAASQHHLDPRVKGRGRGAAARKCHTPFLGCDPWICGPRPTMPPTCSNGGGRSCSSAGAPASSGSPGRSTSTSSGSPAGSIARAAPTCGSTTTTRTAARSASTPRGRPTSSSPRPGARVSGSSARVPCAPPCGAPGCPTSWRRSGSRSRRASPGGTSGRPARWPTPTRRATAPVATPTTAPVATPMAANAAEVDDVGPRVIRRGHLTLIAG